MGDYGIKISKNSVEVLTGDIKDMVLHSEHYGMKIASQGTANISVTSGSGGSTTVAHGRSNVPGFLAFCKMTGSKVFPPSAWNYEGNYEQFLASSDGTNLNFSIDSNASSNYTAVVYYYILVEPSQ